MPECPPSFPYKQKYQGKWVCYDNPNKDDIDWNKPYPGAIHACSFVHDQAGGWADCSTAGCNGYGGIPCPEPPAPKAAEAKAEAKAAGEGKAAAKRKAATRKDCNNHGHLDESGSCICDTGWTGTNCSAVDQSAAIKMHCTPGKTNAYDAATQACICTPGWTGSKCDKVDQKAMMAQHSCVPGHTKSYDMNKENCECVDGYTGSLCQDVDEDAMIDLHCTKGQTNRYDLAKKACECKPAFRGARCETRIICNDHGTDTGVDGACVCGWGWTGTQCERQLDAQERLAPEYRRQFAKQQGCPGKVLDLKGNCTKFDAPHPGSSPIMNIVIFAAAGVIAVVAVTVYMKFRKQRNIPKTS